MPEVRFAPPVAPQPDLTQAADRAITAVVLTTSTLVAFVATLLLFLHSASLSYCPPTTSCSNEGAVLGFLLGTTLIHTSLSAGIALCMWRLVMGRSAWWIALLALASIIFGTIIGFEAVDATDFDAEPFWATQC